MSRSYRPPNQAIIVDLTNPLEDMMMVLADHCEEAMFTSQELLMLGLTHLHFDFYLNEAIESVMFQVEEYCQFTAYPHIVQRIERQITQYLSELHSQFNFYHLYDTDGELQYTLGGWVCDFTPYFIPRTSLPHFASAVSSVVTSEYDLPRPFKVDKENRDVQFWNPASYLKMPAY